MMRPNLETRILLVALVVSMVSNGLLVVLIARLASNGASIPGAVQAAITGVQQYVTYSNN